MALAEGSPAGVVNWMLGDWDSVTTALGMLPVTELENTSRIVSVVVIIPEWISQGEVISRAKREM